MSKTTTPTPVVHHPFRTFLAAIFGIVAFCLILATILVVWLNRTVLDTATYVQTVAPLVNRAEVQAFVAEQATQKLLESAPTQEVATTLLGEGQVSGKTDQQLLAELQPVVKGAVLEVVQSAGFAELWKTTNQTAHSQLVSQLNGGGAEVTLDLSPTVAGVIDQLEGTKLGPIAEKMSEEPIKAELNLKGSALDTVYYYFRLFKQVSWVLVGVTILAILLSIGISVNHVKTLRRIVFGTGILAGVLAVALSAPPLVGPSLSGLEQQAALAVAEVLTHNLQIATISLAVVCLVFSIGSKFLLKPAK